MVGSHSGRVALRPKAELSFSGDVAHWSPESRLYGAVICRNRGGWYGNNEEAVWGAK